MAMTPYDYNYDFQIREDGAQAVVTNNLGRAALFGELVYLGGYFGYVAESPSIANGATGRIQLLDQSVEVSSAQIDTADTFAIGNYLYFAPGGSSAAGLLVDSSVSGAVKVGVITGEQGTGGAQTAVKFRPLNQAALSAVVMPGEGSAVKVARVVIDAATDYSTTGKATGVPVGSIILDMFAIATSTSSGGTAQLVDGADAVHTAVAMATDGAVARMAAGVDDAQLVTSGALTVKTHASGDAGIVTILYI